MVLNITRPLRLFRISPLVSFKPGAGVVYHPSVEEALANDKLRIKRAAQNGRSMCVYICGVYVEVYPLLAADLVDVHSGRAIYRDLVK